MVGETDVLAGPVLDITELRVEVFRGQVHNAVAPRRDFVAFARRVDFKLNLIRNMSLKENICTWLLNGLVNSGDIVIDRCTFFETNMEVLGDHFAECVACSSGVDFFMKVIDSLCDQVSVKRTDSILGEPTVAISRQVQCFFGLNQSENVLVISIWKLSTCDGLFHVEIRKLLSVFLEVFVDWLANLQHRLDLYRQQIHILSEVITRPCDLLLER